MHELSLAAGALPEFTADVVAEAAGRAGFGMAGFTVDPASWDGAMTRRVARLVEQWQLRVLDVEVVWIPAGGKLDDGHRRIVDVALELGARNLLVVSSEPDAGRTGAALHRLCEWSAPGGMRVALEFLMITAVRTLPDALAAVRRCDHPSAAILVDALHLQRSGGRPDDLRSLERRLLPYAQLCDGPASCGDSQKQYLEDALDRRDSPGRGELPLRELLTVLADDCPLSLEVRSRRVREALPDPVARAHALRRDAIDFLQPAAGER